MLQLEIKQITLCLDAWTRGYDTFSAGGPFSPVKYEPLGLVCVVSQKESMAEEEEVHDIDPEQSINVADELPPQGPAAEGQHFPHLLTYLGS